jgi:hypothetical protein
VLIREPEVRSYYGIGSETKLGLGLQAATAAQHRMAAGWLVTHGAKRRIRSSVAQPPSMFERALANARVDIFAPHSSPSRSCDASRRGIGTSAFKTKADN